MSVAVPLENMPTFELLFHTLYYQQDCDQGKKTQKLNSNPTLRNPLENLLLRNPVLEAASSSNQLIYQSWSAACLLPQPQQELKQFSWVKLQI